MTDLAYGEVVIWGCSRGNAGNASLALFYIHTFHCHGKRLHEATERRVLGFERERLRRLDYFARKHFIMSPKITSLKQ